MARMLLRLILGLLMAALALPAMAHSGCHDDMPMAMASAHRGMPMPISKHDGTATEHLCAGCIPPSTWRSGVPGRARLATIVPLVASTYRLDLATSVPPATPPPRRTA
jgi:hypothetical protein